jgi:hypothetical protein
MWDLALPLKGEPFSGRVPFFGEVFIMRHRIHSAGGGRGRTVAAFAFVLALLAHVVAVGTALAVETSTCPRAGDPNCLVAVPLTAADVAA